MFAQDTNDDLYLIGLKLYYDSKKIELKEDMFDKKEISLLACGTRHYMAVTKNNDLAIWGNVLADQSEHNTEGFNIYSGDQYFDDGQIEQL